MLLAITISWVLGGCVHLPKIRLKGLTATAPADPGKPATAAVERSEAVLPIPRGSIVDVIQLPKIGGMGEPIAQPIIRATLAQPSTLSVTTENQTASTGTVDTAVASRRVDNEARRPLLYAAIGSGVMVGVFMFLKFPTPAFCAGAAAVVFFLAWQMAGLPVWFHAIGIAALVGGAALYLGYEKKENEVNKSPPINTPV